MPLANGSGILPSKPFILNGRELLGKRLPSERGVDS